jgi:hypothetical protein
MHDRDIAKIEAIHSTVPGDWDKFRRLRNIVNKEIKLAIKSLIIEMHLCSTVAILERHGRLSMT